MTYKIENIKFDNDKIILNKNNHELQIDIKDIYTTFYAKWSLKNYFRLAHTPSLTMGILYIATKKMVRMSEVIRIKIPLKNLLSTPSLFYKKIQSHFCFLGNKLNHVYDHFFHTSSLVTFFIHLPLLNRNKQQITFAGSSSLKNRYTSGTGSFSSSPATIPSGTLISHSVEISTAKLNRESPAPRSTPTINNADSDIKNTIIAVTTSISRASSFASADTL